MNYTIKPEEHELREARQAVEQALEKARHALEVSADVDYYLAWDGRPYTREKMGGVSGRTAALDVVTLAFNSEADGWKKNIRRTAVHEYGHLFFYDARGEMSDFMWQFVLEEALAQHLAEKLFPEGYAPWNERYSVDKIQQHWDDIKPIIEDEEIDYDHPLFLGGGDFPEWIGYSVAYLIGEKLLENHELEDLPDLTRSDVLEAGDRLFG
ncbi:MAG: DUF2268 domain-containing putative Zn-dependent protease [Candidatus Nanohaloarchaea archaeon]